MKRLILYGLTMLGAHSNTQAQTTLSLEEYKTRVLSYNQSVKSAQETVKAAKAAAREVKTAYFPQLDGTASYSFDFNPPVLALGSLNVELKAPSWSAGGQLTQNIYSGGKLSATYKSMKIQQDIAGLVEQLTTDNIGYTAEVAYWNTAASKAFWDTSIRYLNILKNLYNIVQTRFDDGLISKTDLLKIETSLKEASYQASKAQQAYSNSSIILNVLMGAPAQDSLLLTDSLSIANPAIEPLSYDDVLQRRPDYLARTKEIEWQKQLGRIDQSEFLPKAYIGGSIDYGTLLLNLNNNTIWSPRLFAGINLPIFHWGKSKHSRDKNRALTITKQLNQSTSADEIKKELATALNNLQETDSQITIAKDNLNLARQSMDLHTFSYEEGHISILDVQAAQLSWLQSYVNLIESYLNNKLAVAAYWKAISE